MRISKDFILREIAGDYIILPTQQEALKFQGLITVNEQGRFLWELLQKDVQTRETLTAALCDVYDVDPRRASADLEDFFDQLYSRGILRENEDEA